MGDPGREVRSDFIKYYIKSLVFFFQILNMPESTSRVSVIILHPFVLDDRSGAASKTTHGRDYALIFGRERGHDKSSWGEGSNLATSKDYFHFCVSITVLA